MTGFILFRNAVLRVIRHIDEALAVSGLIWIAILIVQILVFEVLKTQDFAAGEGGTLSGPVILFLILSYIVMFVGPSWIAVEWHRFTLEGKRPTSAFPRWNGGRVWSYLFLSIVMGVFIGVMIGVAIAVLGLLFGSLFMQPVGVLLLSALVGLPAVYVFLRMSPVLPGVALGDKISFATAWKATQPHSAVIFQAGILTIAAFLLMQFLSPLFGSGFIGLLYELAAGWVLLMINVSLLSAIYELAMKGHLDD
ncbi:hypothetical protein [Celeribacter neptunius]|uniref:Membrane domain of glycerophosphoryl diester phosphodiesterase n=1 Tax=Celeribacter neptunius TaxID=588602 RepID=A0A1I3SLI5_9RHOB|nr:hypothetical protein [Celeribacter neptunius]SFJ59052.1 hypothetical protein SAMN04487991_2498 [Celeribacter neptunius]